MCAPCTAQEASVKKLLIQSDPAIQEQIRTTANAFLSGKRTNTKTNWKGFREITNLNELADDKEEIVKQVAIFASSPTSDEHRPLMALMILHMLDPPPKVVIPALAPYLDADNPQLRSFVHDWFQGHDNAGTDETKLKPVNFDDYADYVRKARQSENLPTAFIQYLYERSPNRAFLVFVRTDRQSNAVKGLKAIRKKLEKQGAYTPDGLPQPRTGVEKNELLLAEHTISNAIWLRKHYYHERFPEASQLAKQQLSNLAEMDQWWVRLYVAEIMRRNRELRLADVLDRLSRDSNALVSKAVKSARE